MHHAGAEHFDPAFAPAGAAAIAAAEEAVDGHVHPRLDEGEVVAAEAHPPLLAEHPLGELEEGALEVGHADPLVHRQQLDLREHPLATGVGGFVAVAPAGDCDADGRLVLLHEARLVGRGMGAQQEGAAVLLCALQPERVLHIAGRMVLRDAQRGEVIVLRLDLRPLDHREAHRDEASQHLPHRLRHRVQPADALGPAGQRHVQPAGLYRGRQTLLLQLVAFRFEGRLQLLPQPVRLAAETTALLQRQLAQSAQHQRQAALPAEVGDAPLLERRLIASGGELFSSVRGQFAQVYGLCGHRTGIMIKRQARGQTTPP